jgi:putative RNA 2'-phosphotransferase
MKLSKIDKYLSKLLRHDPEDLEMDIYGYVKVNKLIRKLNISFDDLNSIVINNNKQRFEFNSDYTKIKDSQGHSISNLQLELKEIKVPITLYHGTHSGIVQNIMIDGLKKISRNHVYFTNDFELATKRAKTHANMNKHPNNH